jgi:WD40 repeat protein
MNNDLVFGYSLEGHSQEIQSICFSFNGKLLASGSKDKTLTLTDLKER